MNKEIRRLPDAELEIMLAVWPSSEGVSSAYILERIKESRGWSLQTLLTVLSRSADRGTFAGFPNAQPYLCHQVEILALTGTCSTHGDSLQPKLCGYQIQVGFADNPVFVSPAPVVPLPEPMAGAVVQNTGPMVISRLAALTAIWAAGVLVFLLYHGVGYQIKGV